MTIPCKRALLLSDLTFRTDGSVALCCFDFNRKLVFGNIMNESLEDIIENEKLKRLQQLHRNGEILTSGLICKDCDQIRDRTSALIYTSDKKMHVGETSNQTFSTV
jgi:radical SAM protein with 4Fe4S-binding SPASM domain